MTYVVSEKYVNVRIDKALSEIFNISRNKLLTHAEIYVNDNKVKMSYKLALNDKVDFEIKEVSYNLKAKDIYIEIIYEDDKYNGTDSDRAAKRMLDAAGVKYTKIPAFELNIL